MPVGFTQSQNYLKVTTPAGADVLLLRACRGEEALSEPFLFTLEMVAEKVDIDFSKIVGKGATVVIEASGGAKRYMHGIMTRFVQGGTTKRFTSYVGELRPWFWLLTLTSDHRIYQKKSVLDIAKALFSELGFSDYRDTTSGTHAPREYAVQHGETAFEFISRLFEEEGIHYFFEHADGKHTLVMADDNDAHAECAGPTTLRYQGTGTDRVEDDVITTCLLEQQITPTAYTLDDFEFTTPSTDLAVSVKGESGPLRLYDYPGGYSKNDQGDSLAKIRLEAWEAESKSLAGSSTVRTFTPGYTFKLSEHERHDMNARYLLRRVTHIASLEEYTNSFEAIPASVKYRPPKRTPKRRIPGAETAIVVGKSGEEIWTDEHGRVKVQFHWDQKGKNDENSSCWVRVAQAWAGKSWGALFTPRIGQEVVVSFLDGDPDRPLVTGAVYNGQNAPPYPLPGQQTRSTIKTNSSKGGGGSNEIRFEDKRESEELYFHAQKDLVELVEHDHTSTVKHNETVTVEGDYTLKITGKLTIEAQGAVSIKSAVTLSTEAGTAMTNKAGTELNAEAGGIHVVKGSLVKIN
jgi:type VI secretion system secreted protein VgrG